VPAGVGPTLPPAQAPPILSTSVSFIWPVAGTLWGGFGPRWGSFHKGIDIGASYGTPIVAAAAGQIVLSTYSDNGYGSYVIVRHGDGSQTLYAHMSERYVTLGQFVSQGETIGAVGCTGWCTGNHVHFEVHIGGAATDPIAYLP
jgi:murein DD-endopeptidase MepM/ murein hydrolase activator NlpD